MNTFFAMFKTFKMKLRDLFFNGEGAKSSNMEKPGLREDNSVDIERLLAQPQPLPKVSAEMHNAILRAVQKSACGPSPKSVWSWNAILKPQALVYALTVLLLAGSAWWTVDNRSLRHKAVLTSQMSETFAFIDGFGTNAPMLLARPIEAQFSELTNDFNRTKEIVLASLP